MIDQCSVTVICGLRSRGILGLAVKGRVEVFGLEDG